MSNKNNALYKIFGIFSSLYLLAGTYLSSYVALNQEIKFYDVFQAIDEIFSLVFPVVALISAVLIFIKYVFDSQKISGKLISILLLITVFTASFAHSIDLPYMLYYVYSGFVLAVIALINIFIFKEPKETKGAFLTLASVMFLIANIITAAPYVSTIYYTISALRPESIAQYSTTSVIIISVICIITAISFLGEGIFAVLVAISKKINKKTIIIMLVWALINTLLKIFIPAQLIEIPLYLLYTSLGLIDVWLVYINWNLLRYFFYLLFIYSSLNFYKKEKPQKIEE